MSVRNSPMQVTLGTVDAHVAARPAEHLSLLLHQVQAQAAEGQRQAAAIGALNMAVGPKLEGQLAEIQRRVGGSAEKILQQAGTISSLQSAALTADRCGRRRAAPRAGALCCAA